MQETNIIKDLNLGFRSFFIGIKSGYIKKTKMEYINNTKIGYNISNAKKPLGGMYYEY